MKHIWPAFILISLSACQDRVTDEEADAAWAFVNRETKAQEDALRGIESVQYAPCEIPWSNGLPTACGAKLFSDGMAECTARAARWTGGMARLDAYAGNSWIMRAGSANVRSNEERVQHLTTPDDLQTIAMVGGESRAIRPFVCDFRNLKLRGIEWQPPIN